MSQKALSRSLSGAAAIALLAGTAAFAQDTQEKAEIPAVYSNIEYSEDGKLQIKGPDGKFYPLKEPAPTISVDMVRGNPKGADDGFTFTFSDPDSGAVLKGGTLFFSLIDFDHLFPLPKYRYSAAIDENGNAHVVMNGTLNGQKDFTDWVASGKGHLYSRVQAADGEIMGETIFAFTADSKDGPYHVVETSIVEGPFLEKMTHESVTVAFETMTETDAQVEVPGVGTFKSEPGQRHEVEITGLEPSTTYAYTASTSGDSMTFDFTTAPEPGSREPFSFAFGSDSRHGIDSGERHAAGINEYMIRRLMPLATANGASFMHFTGDLINGYNTSPTVQKAQYVNWKRAVTPFWARFPMFVGVGNHEVVVHQFDDGSKYGLEIPRFPFETEGPGAVFRSEFANFENGPKSEDGSALDPDPNKDDFPSYAETVFDYTWANIAVINLNSDYLYSPYLSDSGDGLVGGNIHGYIMDNQLAWLKERLEHYQSDDAIDHVFLTVHTPIFPNGGHVSDDMFYDGDNSHRPVIAGTSAEKGIVERRDEILAIINDYDKISVVMAGDEHNYSRVHVQPGMPIYAENGYQPETKQEITRSWHHITNGATGAPYYGIDPAPWHVGYDVASDQSGDYLMKFTTQFALVFFNIDGSNIDIEVIDPETLELIERVRL